MSCYFEGFLKNDSLLFLICRIILKVLKKGQKIQLCRISITLAFLVIEWHDLELCALFPTEEIEDS